jgi:hypothetical protein
MNTVYHKIFSITPEQQQLLIAEISSNQDLYKPLTVSFGQYAPRSSLREIVSIRSFTSAHDQLKYPFDIPSFAENAQWNERSKKFPHTKEFAEQLCQKLGGLGIGKVMYARIPPGETINWHTDFYPLYSGFARVHIPLISAAGASTFYTEHGDFVMEENSVYIYDTKPAHTTKNNSDQDRTHLIVDVLVEREKYFPPVTFLIEEIKNVCADSADSKLNSAEFKETFANLATLLFYVNVHCDGTATLLWNSRGSRAKFFEHFDLTFGTQEPSNLAEIPWDCSYGFVKNDMGMPGKCYVLRNDFK